MAPLRSWRRRMGRSLGEESHSGSPRGGPGKVPLRCPDVTQKSGFAEFSGAGIRKQKQLGREKTRSEPSFPVSLVVKLNLGDEIQPKWGRFVTSQFSSRLRGSVEIYNANF